MQYLGLSEQDLINGQGLKEIDHFYPTAKPVEGEEEGKVVPSGDDLKTKIAAPFRN